jgi:hypothetical protein
MTFPTPAPRVPFSLVLKAAVGGSTLGTYELLDFSGGAYRLNVAALKPYGSNRQNFKGDGTYIIDNLKFTLRVKGVRATTMGTLLANVKATKALTFGSYTVEIAAGVGITSWAPLGPADSKVQVEFIPADTFWTGSTIAVV